MMGSAIIQELRSAVRSLLARPAFALAAVSTLGLGLGVNAAFLTILNSALRPPRVSDEASLVRLRFSDSDGKSVASWQAEFAEARLQSDVFADVLSDAHVETELEGRVSRGSLVSGNYFRMLGARLEAGHFPEATTSSPVVVLSHRSCSLWFGSPGTVVGRQVRIGGRAFHVIGVAARDFSGIDRAPVDYWIPMASWEISGFEAPATRIVAKLRPDVTPEIAQRVVSAHSGVGGWGGVHGVQLQPALDYVSPFEQVKMAALPFLALFGLTLTAPCINMANLLMAQAAGRHRELGIRLALGASRSALTRMLLVEGFVVASLAGLLGLVAGAWLVNVGVQLVFRTIPQVYSAGFGTLIPPLTLDYRVFAGVSLASCMSAVIFGLGPALHASGQDAATAMRGEFAGWRIPPLRNKLIICQACFSTLLLIAALTLMRNGLRLSLMDVGYDDRHVYGFPLQTDPARAARLLREDLAVDSLARVSPILDLFVAPPPGGDGGPALFTVVTEEYFRCFRIPVERGREFTAAEVSTEAPLVILSRAAAKRYWPGGDALGKTLSIDGEELRKSGLDAAPAATAVTVVGIAGDVVSGRLWAGIDEARLYFPGVIPDHRQTTFVRLTRDSEAAPEQIRGVLAQVQSSALAMVFPAADLRTIESYPILVIAWLSIGLGGVAVGLTAAGLYGVLSLVVQQRFKEIGIRSALGAGPARVMGVIAWYAARLVFTGVLCGAGLFAAAESVVPVDANLHLVLRDGVAYSTGCATLLLVGLSASIAPAIRAARVSPWEALRKDG